MIGYLILFVVILLFVLWYLSFHLCLGFYHKAICHTQNDILYSFDDGPSIHTPHILKILKQHNKKAIFFCIGQNIAKYPEIFAEILTHGHEVGNHSYTHSNLFGFKSVEQIVKEIQNTDKIMKKYGAAHIRYFRPPFGVINPNISKALKITKHDMMGWSIRSFDTVLPVWWIQKRVAKTKLHDIVLLHDSQIQTAQILNKHLEHL
jgi:peptidoglycan/xylan/chitin deacetylase (PgdA/CDA1 family)